MNLFAGPIGRGKEPQRIRDGGTGGDSPATARAALGWSPSAPSTTLELGKGKTTLTGEDAAQFRREMGEATAKAVRAFAARHKNLDKLDREDAVDTLKKMVDDARKPVRRRWATRRVPLAEVVR